MTKLRKVLATAAALVLGGGMAIGIALNQAGQAHNITTSEWCASVKRISDIQRQEHFFVAVQSGTAIPKAWPDGESGRLLGDCSGGQCTIAPDAAPHCAYTYGYDCGPQIDGWRVCELFAHPYVARGWAMAANDMDGLRWYGSLSSVVAACRDHFTAAQCLTLLQADKKCWLLDDGSVCRYGIMLGGSCDEEPCGTTPCPYAQALAWLPCTVYRGAGSEMSDASKVWNDEEMDRL